MTTQIITGILAFSGAFVGAILNRLTQHQTWLREKRSEAFAEFLRNLDIARTKATDVLIEFRDKNEPALMGVRLHEIYQPVLIQSKIVRLYLPENERENLSKLVKNIYILHSSPHLGDSRLSKVDEDIDKIQTIFEVALLGNRFRRWFQEEAKGLNFLRRRTKT
jgi:hypothetical protein